MTATLATLAAADTTADTGDDTTADTGDDDDGDDDTDDDDDDDGDDGDGGDEIEEFLAGARPHEAAAYHFLVERGYDPADALNRVEDVSLYQGDATDAAREFVQDCYGREIKALPDFISRHLDWEAIASELEDGGDFQEFEHDGETWTCTNPCEF